MYANNVKIQIVNWESDNKQLTAIRHHVFIEEQNVPEEMEWDEHDNSSTHFIATFKNKTVATARLKLDGQIGRMAVLAKYRNQGIGSKLLQFIIKNAKDKKIEKLYLHAQVDAINFYEQQGFSICSEIFHEANIPHRKMSKIIHQEKIL